LTARRILVLLCLAAILAVAVGAAGHGLPVAVLAPFWVVLAVLAPVAFRLADDDVPLCAAPATAVLPARAPPVR
jgi:hypothetical protein